MADLKEIPSYYESLRNVGDVLIGKDTARSLIEASSSGNDTALRSLLSQPPWIETMLEKPYVIYTGGEMGVPNNARQVLARRISNIERCLMVAAENGHAAVVSILLAFATHQSVDVSDVLTRSVINKAIGGGHGAVFIALASTYPNVINFPLPHGALPLYDAVRRHKPDVVAVLLELGADPLRPNVYPGPLASHHTSLMSHAVADKGLQIIEMLLEHGTPITHTAALHTAARCGRLGAMRLLLQHGADINEVLPDWYGKTPMHSAAFRGQVDAMKLLEEYGAHPDIKDVNGKTAAQLLEECNTA